MADDPVTGRGGSLIFECKGGKPNLIKKEKPNQKGWEYHHRIPGTITSVEVRNDGNGFSYKRIPVTGSQATRIVIHYRPGPPLQRRPTKRRRVKP